MFEAMKQKAEQAAEQAKELKRQADTAMKVVKVMNQVKNVCVEGGKVVSKGYHAFENATNALDNKFDDLTKRNNKAE
jgi:hypothetical protein